MPLTNTQFLQILFTPADFSSLNMSERSDFIIVLRQQKIIARFAHSCLADSLIETFDPSSQRHLQNALHVSNRLKRQVVEEAKGLNRILQPASEFVVFLKGAAYSLSNRQVGEGRIYGDIDILINKEQLDDCEKALAVEGWFGQEITDYDDKYYRQWAHEIPPLMHLQRGTIIDVHHNIIPIISKDAPTVKALASHIVKNQYGLQVLSMEAQFVHSAVHLFRNEDYVNAFRDIQDLYFMLKEAPSDFLQQLVTVAESLGFVYEIGLALYFVHTLFSQFEATCLVDEPTVKICLDSRSKLRQKFDIYIFKDVLRPQHELLTGSQTPLKQFLAIVRGHCIKMPLHLLGYHLLVKSGRGIIESLFGKHVFAPKDEQSEQQKY